MEAYQLKTVDDNYRDHWRAFLNFKVRATKQVGKKRAKPVYDRFDKFFDYKKELKAVRNKKKEHKERFSGIGKILRREGT